MSMQNGDSRSPLLEFTNSVFPLADATDERFSIDGTVGQGEIVLVVTEDRLHDHALTSAICGLLPPLTGSIRFSGHDWMRLPTDQANALRGHIGIAFGRETWLPHLPVLETVVLAQMHHTYRDADAILDEAIDWAMHFGLPGLPGDLPHLVSAQDLQGTGLVRAFLGEPALIVIEHPTTPFQPERLTALINAVAAARDRNAAIVWYTREEAMPASRKIPASRVLHLANGAVSAGTAPS